MRGRLSMKRVMIFVFLLVLVIGLIGCNVENKYKLRIEKVGEGTVEPAEGTYEYEEDTIVTLSTTADPGWYFSKWSGADCNYIVNNKVTIMRDMHIIAVFSQLEYSLDITVTPQDAGQVNKEILPGVQSKHGETVRLTAISNVGYVFDHWEGDLTGSDNPANLMMDSDKNITAVFTKLDYNINISVNPQDSGTVTQNIDSDGQTLTVTAVAANGYVFDHWEGDLTGSDNPANFMIDSDKNITAVFNKLVYSLNISVNPPESGTVTKNIDSSNGYEHGQKVTLTANPEPETGYFFDRWEGDLTGSDNPVSLTMDDNKSVTAVFILWQFLNIPMRQVPGAASFPTKIDDTGTCTTVNYTYWMAETEVTYEQWSVVYSWAVTHGYTFANSGTMGDGSGDTANHPVTTINWRDAMVWCNALTEYYNVQEGTSLACVYQYNGEIVRNATNTTACDNVTVDTSAKGFRLPTSMEWELAGRYRGNDDTNAIEQPVGSGMFWTNAHSASGATDVWENVAATKAVAWYNINSSSSTHVVASKTPNTLGLYDMSGNVYELCFDWFPEHEGDYRVKRGGSWSDEPHYLQLGFVSYSYPDSKSSNLGFRLVRTE